MNNATPYVKDAFHEYLVHGREEAVNPAETGTKAAHCYRQDILAGASATLRLRFTNEPPEKIAAGPFGKTFDEIFAARIGEAGEFYARRIPGRRPDDSVNVQRQAYAGLLWSKQFYQYDLRRWLAGDPAQPGASARATVGTKS